MPSIQNKCLTPECRQGAASGMKGLCIKCYAEAKKLVEASKTTWLDLQILGLALSDESKFMQAFNSKKPSKET